MRKSQRDCTELRKQAPEHCAYVSYLTHVYALECACVKGRAWLCEEVVNKRTVPENDERRVRLSIGGRRSGVVSSTGQSSMPGGLVTKIQVRTLHGFSTYKKN